MQLMTDALGSLGMLVLQHARGWDGRGPMMGDPMEGWGPGPVGILFLLLSWVGLLALVAWLVVRIFPRVRGGYRPEAPRDSAEEILRERFARGEISAEEYERSLEVLRARTARQPDDRETRGN